LAAVFFFAVARFAGARLTAVFLFAVERLAVDFFAAVLRAPVFFAAAFFGAARFAAVFFFAEERVDPERELERDVDRAAAGIARAGSALSISSVSPIVGSPQMSSAASAVGSLHEPAFDASDVSPVPLQSSWVM
jgi:hypothetical protein